MVLLALLAGLLAAPPAGAAPPQIGPQWTAGVGTASAVLRAEVNPGGLPTAYRFHYLPESAWLANLAQGKDGFAGARKLPAGADPTLAASNSFLVVSQASGAGSLEPDTAYRFRAQATNAEGTSGGPPLRFRSEAFFGGSLLAPGRAWELVSPPDKGGGEVQGPRESFGGGLFRAAAAGGAITFSSTSSFADPQSAPPVGQYLSRRAAAGWSTDNISAATQAGAFGEEPDGAPYRLASPDLGRLAMFDGSRYSLRGDLGQALALVPPLPGLRLEGASPDLAHLAFSSPAGLHRFSGQGLVPLGVLPGEAEPAPGAALAAPRGAVSVDGNRAYFTYSGNLYLREGSATVQVDEAIGGGASFQAASADGAVAYLTEDGHLYRRQAPGHALADLTPAGGVAGVLAASEDGTAVYFQDAEGLKLRRAGATTLIAPGAEAAHPSSFPPATGSARATPSGSHLAFLSRAPLGGQDNRQAPGAGTSCDEEAPPEPERPCAQLYLYEAASGTLTCASCNPTAERPRAPTVLPGALLNGSTLAHKPRVLAEDGRRLFFESADSLVPQDESAARRDVYEWRAEGTAACAIPTGCLALISQGRSGAGARFLDASASGAEAFFLTSDSLLAQDSGFADIYVAREGGGFPEPTRPIECVGDSCQPLPSAPEDPTPGSLVPSPGNPPVRFEKASRGARCKRGFVRKRGRCVRRCRAASLRKGRRCAKRKQKRSRGAEGRRR